MAETGQNTNDALTNLVLGHFELANNPIEFAAARNIEGKAWIENLPVLIGELCHRWDLEVEDGTASHGYHAVVLSVRRRDEACVLKLAWPAVTTANEAMALSAWDGRGAVRMLEADTAAGAMLLERLDAQRTLRDIEIFEAAEVAGRLLQQLAVPAPSGFQALQDVAREIVDSLEARQVRLGHPVPANWLETAQDLARQLETRADCHSLVHGDLHYGNVLAGERAPWLAIDPKPIAGDPEYAVPELLWTRVDDVNGGPGIRRLLKVLIESGTLDAEMARSWAIVRCVDYWLWGTEHGLTEDPIRCRRILEALV